jgi:hypothetical protein
MSLSHALLFLFAVPLSQEPRPPAVPLVVHDPYFSIWMPYERANAVESVHWTGREMPLTVLLKIDGKPYRVLGAEPSDVPPAEHVSLHVGATRTVFALRCGGADVEMRFVTPALPDDLDVLSRPVTYLEIEATSRESHAQPLAVHVEMSGALAVNDRAQEVVGVALEWADVAVVAIASSEQPVLLKRGDDLRIDWGTAYLATDHPEASKSYGPALELRSAFLEDREPDLDTDISAPVVVDDLAPTASLTMRAEWTESTLRGGTRRAAASAMIAYDDEWSIRYFGEDLRPYWRRSGGDARKLLAQAAKERDALGQRCREFDEQLASELTSLGGAKWAALCALAYRQCLGANKLCADANGRPLLFPKENFSNGCIATVDVIYPMAPLILLLGSDLSKAMLVPVLDYGSSERWRFPFAPHDLGTYPHATGQVYGGGERTEQNQMPVEESANLILLVAALAQREGNAEFAGKYWPALEKWARYLAQKGLDPENQLCTDDFTGHLAHNVNLSCKAILAIGAFAKLAEGLGKSGLAAEMRSTAEHFANEWIARTSAGESSPLAFDKPGTWSQKYNLAWDRVLGLGLFPDAVRKREVAAYRKLQNRYGLPLDSRATFTKIDWTHWSACLGTREDFEALVAPMWSYVHETSDRVPICDWSDTLTAQKINMIARPVVGGLFMRALHDPEAWKRWFERGARGGGEWAPIPIVTFEPLVPTAESGAVEWSYTFGEPEGAWFAPEFDATSWKSGSAGFGTQGTPSAVVRTEWNGSDIWLRRAFELDAAPPSDVQLFVHHDESAEVYLNGVLAARIDGFTTSYEPVPIQPAARATLRAGRNQLAIHCSQTSGGQYIDAGLVRVVRPPRR